MVATAAARTIAVAIQRRERRALLHAQGHQARHNQPRPQCPMLCGLGALQHRDDAEADAVVVAAIGVRRDGGAESQTQRPFIRKSHLELAIWHTIMQFIISLRSALHMYGCVYN